MLLRPMNRLLPIVIALALLAAGAAAPALAAPELPPPAGQRPPYVGERALSTFTNEAAVVHAVWVPGLERGFVPQGIALVDGDLLISGYGEIYVPPEEFDRSRIYRVDAKTGDIRGSFMLPKEVKHAGGLVYDGHGTVFLADTHALYRIDLAASLASADHTAVVKGVATLGGKLRGSFITYDGTALWLGRYSVSLRQKLSRIDPARVVGEVTLTDADVSGQVPISELSQGAAFDGQGRLWLSQSSSTFGRLQRVDPRTGAVEAAYEFASGVEGLVFAPDGTLWTLSEAGARRYMEWFEFHPLILAVDVNKLK